jgi:hypothetical protein
VTFRMAVRLTVALITGLTIGVASAQSVSASPLATRGPGVATLQGQLIDLSQGWQDAQTCLVFSATDTRCFTTHAEADVLLGYTRQTDPLYQRSLSWASLATAFAVPACSSGWLCLYADPNGGGRKLQFKDELWQYLSNWGFDRQTSSWRNNQGSSDVGHLSLYNRSTVYNCGANSYANSMGIYNDQAYAVWG